MGGLRFGAHLASLDRAAFAALDHLNEKVGLSWRQVVLLPLIIRTSLAHLILTVLLTLLLLLCLLYFFEKVTHLLVLHCCKYAHFLRPFRNRLRFAVFCRNPFALLIFVLFACALLLQTGAVCSQNQIRVFIKRNSDLESHFSPQRQSVGHVFQ